jgi:hypothetical protein
MNPNLYELTWQAHDLDHETVIISNKTNWNKLYQLIQCWKIKLKKKRSIKKGPRKKPESTMINLSKSQHGSTEIISYKKIKINYEIQSSII